MRIFNLACVVIMRINTTLIDLYSLLTVNHHRLLVKCELYVFFFLFDRKNGRKIRSFLTRMKDKNYTLFLLIFIYYTLAQMQ